MALHPIKALDHVIDEYRDYLRSEFWAKDPGLREALERELDAPQFLAQEPFYRAHRPFKDGKRWDELPLDGRLARVMKNRSKSDWAYLHQSLAIDELLSPNPKPVVVTTGTGSGKTEAFLLPVIENAFRDATHFKKSGVTAILVYPMNALANDQKLRIESYLSESGFAGSVRVEQYDRSTSQAKRQEMRSNPPHILLTNYMMLEYLLVRPADRDHIFANHRCRFLVLDEVHSYRGILGSNIALLVRRLRVHLRRASQDWKTDVPDAERALRFPSLVPVGTSATIKSLAEADLPQEEIIRQRDEAVQGFFGDLAGTERDSIRVFGEELKEIEIPREAIYPQSPQTVDTDAIDLDDEDAVRKALCRLAGQSESLSVEQAARHCRLLWDLNAILIRRPMSISGIVAQLKKEVPERKDTPDADFCQEIEAALAVGAALPDDTPGALRLSAHRFIRGGWKFYRCVNSACGKLYPMGEEQCSECNFQTAPLYLCRNCGADYLRLVGDPEQPLHPSADEREDPEWMLYEPARFNLPPIEDEDEDVEGTRVGRGTRGRQRVPAQIRQRPVVDGSFDPATLRFSIVADEYPLQITMAPARTRCLCCGGTAGSRNVITPVALGTSAAVKVVGEGLAEALDEANRDRPGHDGKERLLIFSDSRQDAAHQARFIIFASRYDRLRRRLLRILEDSGSLTMQKAVEHLGELAVEHRDNPSVPEEIAWIPDEARERIRVWEEAPLLDEIAVNAGYRGTLLNLGLAGVRYNRLDEYVAAAGERTAGRLGIRLDQFEFLCRVFLDEIRSRGALSRPLLQYHPSHVAYPSHFRNAEWERRVKHPQGYPLSEGREVLPYLESTEVPYGIKHHNAWRRPGTGGRGPSLERIMKHLMERFAGDDPDEHAMTAVLEFLKRGSFLTPVELYGTREKKWLLQVNADVVRIEPLSEAQRVRCEVCGDVRPFAGVGSPCPRCHGLLVTWPDCEVEQKRSVRRIRKRDSVPLEAGEHTAQVTTAARAVLEEKFKAPASESPVNVLACSPTLEMGIDVGGLDAVILRNIPPRPDNYAQRGGRAGRRSRVGMVVGYARSTPHDQYFFDKPEEMIAGEVPAPTLSLGNRDVILRHLYAIAFGAAEPGIAGRMVEYISPQGEIKEEAVAALIEGVRAQSDHVIGLAHEAWGADVLSKAELSEDRLRELLNELPDRIRMVVARTSRQVIELRQALDSFAESLEGRYAGTRAADLVARLLGIQSERRGNQQEADDRSAGYPLRRFAEFGLLPGYEFPSEPASLRLLGDEQEEDPITVTRRFGIGQFQPEATVYARRKRWRVAGLDTASPWNPQTEEPTWLFRLCNTCNLRFNGDQPRCPRCGTADPGRGYPSYDFAGFLAIRQERPILDEEERFATRNLVEVYPQWDGDVVGRWTTPGGWALRLSHNEEVRWVNEGHPPSNAELQNGTVVLHRSGKGYPLCPTCGRITELPQPNAQQGGGRRNAGGNARDNSLNHAQSCVRRGETRPPIAISTSGRVEVLRLLAPVPATSEQEQWLSWGMSLGYALMAGMERYFMLSSGELDFELEGPWNSGEASSRFGLLSLSFIDPSLGGSGYLARIANDFDRVARRALDHLDHHGCESACYRCLKAYKNQRYHELLEWPQTLPALRTLASATPETRALQTGDIDDPRPWLEAYAAGVGSPLELKFLRLFERHGYHPEKQVPVSPDDGPPISVADFAEPERRVAIYIDSAAFHVGSNLRRDEFIRRRLTEGASPWRVVVLRASDLSRGEELVRSLLD